MKNLRSDAIKSGDARYLTGRPCAFGHVSTRYTVNGSCVECVRIKASENRKKISMDYNANRAAKLNEVKNG